MPVAWHSATLNKHQINYPVRELEMLAIHECFKKFEYLLLGSPFKVVMKTDHSTLKQVQQGGELTNKRLARWQEYLGGFHYEICWIPGKENLISDGISRSLSGHGKTGLVPISDQNDSLNVPNVSGIAANYDTRFENLDYSRSTEFGTIFEIL